MTEDEFLMQYAERSGCTVKQLTDAHQVAVPCGCNEHDCGGWQLVDNTPHKGHVVITIKVPVTITARILNDPEAMENYLNDCIALTGDNIMFTGDVISVQADWVEHV